MMTTPLPPKTGDKTRLRAMTDYWEQQIVPWSASCYRPQTARGPVGRWMAGLRSSIRARADLAFEILAPHLQNEEAEGKKVLELGAGVGDFALRLAAPRDEGGAGAAEVLAYDIAPAAVEGGRRRAEEAGLADRVRFGCASVEEMDLPPADMPAPDFIVGLGLLDWMPREEIARMFERLSALRTENGDPPRLLFSYSEQDGSLAERVHDVWLCWRLKIFGGGVRAYHHRREEVIAWFEQNGFANPEIAALPAARFGRLIHNLGPANVSSVT